MKLMIKLGVLAMLVTTLTLLSAPKKSSATTFGGSCTQLCSEEYLYDWAACSNNSNPTAETECIDSAENQYNKCIDLCDANKQY